MGSAENLYTDLQSHHIEGMAHAAPELGYFKVPLISEVLPNLWQGGCIDGVELPHDFDVVVSLYPWEQYKLGPNTVRYEFRAYDSAEIPDVREPLHRVQEALSNNQKVLIHCQAGLNRSGLVAALTLISLGYSAENAIALLRDSRCPHVLCNKSFENYLMSLS